MFALQSHRPQIGFLVMLFVVLESLSASAAGKQLPVWVADDCIKLDDSYYFVGYGEGQNSATASRNALISSRQNALTCLFGGTITSTISIRENNTTVNFASTTDLELDYSYVNWSGYQKVADRSHALNDDRTKVYIQYQWSSVAISSEKDRLDKMASQLAETKAKEQEIRVQSHVIRQQKQQLQTLDRQAQELAALKTESEKAVARLQLINSNRQKEQASIVNVISYLYCGITIDEFSDVFRAPDAVSIGEVFYSGMISRIDSNWGDYQVQIKYVDLELLLSREMRKRENFEKFKPRIIKLIGRHKISFIFSENGLTKKGYDLCKKS